MSINRVVLCGRLTKDPELKYTNSGTAVTNFTIAINRPFSNDKGEREADFVNCVIWRKPAESLANFQKKGNLIGVDGRIQTRSFEGQDGKMVYITEVVADSVQFLESKKDGQSSNQSNSQDNDPFKGQQEISSNELPF